MEAQQYHQEPRVLCIPSLYQAQISFIFRKWLQPFQASRPGTTFREESGHFFLPVAFSFLSEKHFPKICSGNERFPLMFHWPDLQLKDLFGLINSVNKKEKPREYTILKPVTNRGSEITQRLNQAYLWSWYEIHFPL